MTKAQLFMKRAFGLMGALGGAASGAQLGSMAGPWGTAIGGVAGGLLGGVLDGGGKPAAPAPKPAPRPQPHFNRLQPTPGLLSSMTRTASLSDDQRKAYDWGIDLFCKKAGLDEEDRAAVHFLVKSAIDDQYSNQFASIGIKKPFQFNAYGGGGYVANGSATSTPTSGPKPLQNVLDAGAKSPGGTDFGIGGQIEGATNFAGKALGLANEIYNPFAKKKMVGGFLNEIQDSFQGSADARAKAEREGNINKAIENKTLGAGFQRERLIADTNKNVAEQAAQEPRLQELDKAMGAQRKQLEERNLSSRINAQGIAPSAAIRQTARGNSARAKELNQKFNPAPAAGGPPAPSGGAMPPLPPPPAGNQNIVNTPSSQPAAVAPPPPAPAPVPTPGA